MVKIFIDDKPVEVESGTTIFNAAALAGISIPHFCYHPAFSPEGTCRMCLVEIEGVPKLELACSTQVREGMKVHTKSDKVVEARKGVLEFLLADHPLDCPICDQAGNCKLQDYYEEYGLHDSRFSEFKEKHNKKKKLGKNLLHDQERCVLCRRCVRFLREVTKTQELGVFERGAHAEINILDGIPVDNNYSGNLAEICPVGAITDLDFRFKTRNWFLEEGDSICPHCGRGCNIKIQFNTHFHRFPMAQRVFRVQARTNPEINSFWMCDLGRYRYKYLDDNRQLALHVKNGDKNLRREQLPDFVAEKINRLRYMNKSSRIALVLNSWLTNEELFLLKKIFCEDLKIDRVLFADPPQAEADDYLLTADRTPNRRGAEEIGFALTPLDLETLSDRTELLLIFGSFFSSMANPAELNALMENIPVTLLFSTHKTEIDPLVNLVIPTPAIPEKSGSLTNCNGIVQSFSPVMEAPGDSWAEWRFLVDLAKKIGINFQYYSQFTSPKAILKEMKREIPFFERKND
ncbi:MAG: (2Fe-2S)-binding protein [Candidatus Aminicenantes bacterium]|nr:(2Fe-2S)-binding protein [Candidatus Aminicenantes bacterium]